MDTIELLRKATAEAADLSSRLAAALTEARRERAGQTLISLLKGYADRAEALEAEIMALSDSLSAAERDSVPCWAPPMVSGIGGGGF